MSDAPLQLYNTLTRSKEVFTPIDPANVRMYVCGPTVYDFAHIGNARPAIVFDVLFRLLRHTYGENHVTYVRNITDVDDKINARAVRDYPDLPLNEAIRRVTETTAAQYAADVKALGCLEPTHEPRATDFVAARADGKPDMIGLIQTLIDRGHAYEAAGEVLFNVSSMKDYGALSRRDLASQVAGARVAVDAHKRNPQDFVLWKQSSADEPGWEAPFGTDAWHEAGRPGAPKGRPGWHIECSAMAAAYLGQTFDIHGGGLDLIFPHHENEIAQSRCAHGTQAMANVWMHNGFLQVEGRKMSKSDGNFFTIRELMDSGKFGGRPWSGRAIRLALLMTDYKRPIDWTVSNLVAASNRLAEWAQLLDPSEFEDEEAAEMAWSGNISIPKSFLSALSNDINTPLALLEVGQQTLMVSESNDFSRIRLAHFLRFLGLLEKKVLRAHRNVRAVMGWGGVPEEIVNQALMRSRRAELAVVNDDSAMLNEQKMKLADLGFRSTLDEFGFLELVYSGPIDTWIDDTINRRLALIAKKNWAEADRIRDELLAQGIQLKDGKDPVTGARVTTWEVKR